MTSRHSEAAFETVIEAHLLKNGYTPVAREGFDRERAIFPATVLAFIRETQPKEWAKLADDAVRVEVLYESETFWLDQRRLAELFGVDVRTVSEHLRNIYGSGGLSEGATLRKIRMVRTEGSREVARDLPDEQLNYRNLLGACLGGNGQPPHLQHCDTRKGGSDIQWNPADAAHHVDTRVRYEVDGSIHADDAGINGQLDQVLNLNLPKLKNNRKSVYDAVLEWWRSEKRQRQGPVPRQRIKRERDRHGADDGQLAPYAQVAVWLLAQKLAGMAA